MTRFAFPSLALDGFGFHKFAPASNAEHFFNIPLNPLLKFRQLFDLIREDFFIHLHLHFECVEVLHRSTMSW